MIRTDRDRRSTIFLLSLFGLLDAGWLAAHSLGSKVRAVCGPVGDCEAVLSSAYSQVLGIPVGVFGAGMYALLMILAYRAEASPSAARIPRAIRVLSLTGLVISLGFMVIQLFVVRAFCLFCSLSALTITCIALLSWRLGRVQEKPDRVDHGGRFRVAANTGIAFLVAVFLAAIWYGQQERNTIVGRIGNEVLRQERMNRELASFSVENERQLLDAQISWVNNTLVQRMLDKEAERRQTTVQALAAEVAGAPVMIADSELAAAVRAFAGPDQVLTPSQQDQVRNLLVQQKQEQRLNQYVDSLKKVYRVEVYLESIPVVNPLLDLTGTPFYGHKDAPAMFVVFTDFQCPFCATVAALLRELVKRHPDDVVVYVKNYPLRMHVNAELAAEASLCANAQGKFLEFHDLLFSNQNSLDESALVRFAGQAGCDTAAFASCLHSGFHKQFIARDIAEAGKNGITGTPTVFLNGRPLLGDLSFEQLESELRALRR